MMSSTRQVNVNTSILPRRVALLEVLRALLSLWQSAVYKSPANPAFGGTVNARTLRAVFFIFSLSAGHFVGKRQIS
jgi:hypothetical protein